MEDIVINLFYPCVFLTIIVLIVTVGIVIVKCKDSALFQNIFCKSSDKMEKMHEDIVKSTFTTEHEKELHRLEIGIREINQKIDILVERVIKLERKQ